MRRRDWLLVKIQQSKNKILSVSWQEKIKCQEPSFNWSPKAGYPLTLKCRLTVAQFRLGVGANYLEFFGRKQPFLLLSSGALIQQGMHKHEEIEAHRFHKIDLT